MTLTSEAYPFLISRSYDNDYQVIVVPRFLADSGESGLLKRATDVDGLTPPGEFLRYLIDSPNVGQLTVLFQIKNATDEDLGRASREILTDPQGRYILFISGVVVRSHLTEEDISLTDSEIQQVNQEVRSAYQLFWSGKIKHQFSSPILIETPDAPELWVEEPRIENILSTVRLKVSLIRACWSDVLPQRLDLVQIQSDRKWLSWLMALLSIIILYRMAMSKVAEVKSGWHESAANLSLPALILSDIEDDPYASEIIQAVQLGYITGSDDGKFHPTEPITRKEFVRILVKMLRKLDPKLPVPTTVLADPFSDVKIRQDGEAAAMIQFVRDNELVKGCDKGSNQFCPSASLTRAEMMAILTEVASYKGVELEPAEKIPFVDIKKHWAEQSIRKMYSCQVIPLGQETKFLPDTKAQRDYATAAIVRFYKYLSQNQ
jgi:S-layer homology domain